MHPYYRILVIVVALLVGLFLAYIELRKKPRVQKKCPRCGNLEEFFTFSTEERKPDGTKQNICFGCAEAEIYREKHPRDQMHAH